MNADRRGELVRYFFAGDSEPTRPLAKVDIVTDPPPYFAPPRSFSGIMVDDLISIAVNKVTIHTRYEPKDYVDLYLIVRSGGLQLENLVPLAKQKMLGLDEFTIAAHFASVDELTGLFEFQRKFMIVPVDLTAMTRFFHEWAERLFAVVDRRRPA